MTRNSNVVLLAAVVGAVFFNHSVTTPPYEKATPSEVVHQSPASASEDSLRNLVTCNLDEHLICTNRNCLCPSDDLRDTISRFFWPGQEAAETGFVTEPAKSGDPEDIAGKTRPDPKLPENRLGVPPDMADKLDFIVAIVPDPVHSHLSLFFDRSLDAIEQAAQDAHYAFGRATMPWDNREHNESTDFRSRLAERSYQLAREEVPGLMIFREQQMQGNLRYLFVFVVGELPTEGIMKRQFQNALLAIRTIRGSAMPGDRITLRIMGPTFSGSLYSLEELLQDGSQIQAFDRVQVHSGTIRSERMKDWFDESKPHKQPNVELSSYSSTDCDELDGFVRFLSKKWHYPPKDIATLSEDETAYGASPSGCSQPKEIYHLYFPRGIASLRAAYEEEISEAQLSGTDGTRPPRSKLQLKLEDTGNDDDTVPTYSHFQTPLSQESVMTTIVSRLRARQSRFILLRATSSLDLVFLSRYLRSNFPQARIVTFGADLLLQSASESTPFRGMLAITQNPVWAGTPELDAARNHPQDYDRIVFPASDSLGTYLAMSSLLRPGHESKRDDPPSWLMALGRNGYWPLAQLRRAQTGDSASLLFPMQATPSWIFLSCLTALLALCYVGLIRKGSVFSKAAVMANFSPVKDPNRSSILVILSILILCAGLSLLLPCLCAVRQAGWSSWWLAGIILPVAGMIGFLYVCFLDLRRREPQNESPRGETAMPSTELPPKLVTSPMVLLAAAGACFALFFSVWWALGSDSLFAYRYVHLSSGLSTLPPILLLIAAGLWWAWQSLAGLLLLDKRRPLLPAAKDLSFGSESPQAARLLELSEEHRQGLLEAARPFGRDIRLYILPLAVAVVLVCIFGALMMRPIQSLEHSAFDLIYAALLALALLALASSLSSLTITWLECRNLLRSLDRFPLRRGFIRLKGFSWTPIWHMSLGSLDAIHVILSREVESITQLGNTLSLKTRRPELWASISAANNELTRIRAAVVTWGNDEDRLVNSFVEFRKKVAAACGAGLRFLLDVWDAEDSSSALDSSNEKSAQTIPRDVEAVEQFVCLVFFNFILIVLLRIRNLALIVAGIYIFVVLSLTSYPFEPRTPLHFFMFAVFFLVASAVAAVFAQMHRDNVLSSITDSKPGELGGDFWLRLGGAVGLPLVGLLAYQFPEIGGFLFSWLQPALQMLK